MNNTKTTVLAAILYTLLVLVVLAGAFGCWRVSYWLQWRFGGVGSYVEERLEALEKRIAVLEADSR